MHMPGEQKKNTAVTQFLVANGKCFAQKSSATALSLLTWYSRQTELTGMESAVAAIVHVCMCQYLDSKDILCALCRLVRKRPQVRPAVARACLLEDRWR